MPTTLDPYCGPAPSSQTLFVSWNFDVILIAVLAVLVAILHMNDPQRKTARTAGLTFLLTLAFISPLCALTTALFSARLAHHIILGSVIAPLIVVIVRHKLRWVEKVPVEAVFLGYTTIYWAWHLPTGYAFALSGTLPYWLMQCALILASVVLWAQLLSTRLPVAKIVGLALGTMVQMGFLGAILTFAQRPLFEAHFLTTQPFGLSPLTDQQLAGVLMWTLGFAPYVIIVLSCLRSRLLRQMPRAGQ